MKLVTYTLLLLCLNSFSYASDSSDIIKQLPHEQKLLQKEKNAANLSAKWIYSNDALTTKDGRVLFSYATSMPTIICSPLNLCDLALQEGEIVRDAHVGDKVRWLITPAMSGSGEKQITHLIIKPKALNLNTSLFIATNKRSYHLRLKSRAAEFMPKVGFKFPRNVEQNQKELSKERLELEKSNRALTKLRSRPQIFRNYKVIGKSKWKPIDVYNDGLKTVIKLPASILSQEAPALLQLTQGEKLKLMNYRIIRNNYVVDSVFDKAVLLAGTGRVQERIEIHRVTEEKRKKRGWRVW
jgi:type IV secretion system protein TrbG